MFNPSYAEFKELQREYDAMEPPFYDKDDSEEEAVGEVKATQPKLTWAEILEKHGEQMKRNFERQEEMKKSREWQEAEFRRQEQERKEWDFKMRWGFPDDYNRDYDD